MKIAVICVSDRSFAGVREDLSGPAISDCMSDTASTVSYTCVPDEKALIAGALTDICSSGQADIIFTTGGTGVAPRDVTPEATLEVADKLVPGLAEAMRAKSMEVTSNAMLSRAVCAIRGETLIINLPGSPKAVRECIEVIKPALEHAVRLIKGQAGDCAQKPAQ